MTHPLFFLHRILRMNQSQYCLSDYSRIFADIWPLANGSRQICAAIVFGHADFADDADFSSWEGFVPQISQIYTDFSSWDYFCHADFADDADFSSWDYFVPQISQIYTDFSSWDYFCPTDFTDIHRFFMESLANRFFRSQGVSATTEQVASAKFRVIR